MKKSESFLFYVWFCKYRTKYSFFFIQISIIFARSPLLVIKHLFFLLYDEFDMALIAIFGCCPNNVDAFGESSHIEGHEAVSDIAERCCPHFYARHIVDVSSPNGRFLTLDIDDSIHIGDGDASFFCVGADGVRLWCWINWLNE